MAHLEFFDRAKCELKVMYLWQNLAEDYRTKVIKYRFLAATKKEMGIKPLHKVKEEDIKSYPNIPFFKILDASEAKYFLGRLRNHELSSLLQKIENMIRYNHSYCTLTARIYDFEREIEQKCNGKSYVFGMDPSRCSSEGRRQTRKGVYNGYDG